MKALVEFVTSAVGPADFPADGLREVAMVGRSNVGKSTLINALLRQRVARTSAAPGKTRLANIFRVTRGAHTPFYLVDLPGYGYARGGAESAQEFQALTHAYFDAEAPSGKHGRGQREMPAALLLVDSRHPAMDKDLEAWRWLQSSIERRGLIGTKIDKLARGQRIRALRELESAYDEPVLPVSAATGEGLDELWKLIDRLASPPNSNRRSTKATATPP
ncbi:MAG: ribosome biogenesis GTP-binding protein YihA/YsxC [Vicinamibacterales bacterium]